MGFADFVNDVKKGFSEAIGGKAVNSTPSFKLFYEVRPNDWYQTYPFYFEITTGDRSGKKGGENVVATFYLPIPPQQMSLQQVTTSEAHPTIGGVVTEVSAPVFYMITMSGTTGMSLNAVGVSHPGTEVRQRQTFDDLAGGPGVASKLSRSLSQNIESISNLVTPETTAPFFKYGSAVSTLPENITSGKVENFESLVSATSQTATAGSYVGKFVGQMAKSFIGNIGDNKKPSLYLNGFAWDHALRQFFLLYQRERSKGTVQNLYFVDMKNNNRFLCVPKNIQFTKSANLPHVSQYTLSLKCWSPDQKDGTLGIDTRVRVPVDRFGEGGDLSEAFTVSAAAAITSFYKTRVKLARYKDIGGAMARDAGGSTF